jgi:hypothetical protein
MSYFSIHTDHDVPETAKTKNANKIEDLGYSLEAKKTECDIPAKIDLQFGVHTGQSKPFA